MRVRKALAVISTARVPRLYRDRNGRGQAYSSLKYLPLGGSGPPKRATLYLGKLSDRARQQVEEAVGKANQPRVFPPPAAVERERAATLLTCLKTVKKAADGIARRSGFYFKGSQLRRMLHASRDS